MQHSFAYYFYLICVVYYMFDKSLLYQTGDAIIKYFRSELFLTQSLTSMTQFLKIFLYIPHDHHFYCPKYIFCTHAKSAVLNVFLPCTFYYRILLSICFQPAPYDLQCTVSTACLVVQQYAFDAECSEQPAEFSSG